MQDFLTALNEEQLKPVLDTEGAVLVTAGAGSGKTRVLTSRVAHLIINKNVSPKRILAITFTNKAASEMRERLSNLVGDISNMWVCTIHKMCMQILWLHGEKLGFSGNFTIYAEAEKDRMLKRLFAEHKIDAEKVTKAVKYHINQAKMLGEPPEVYAENNADIKHLDEVVTIYRAYTRALKENNAMDFDDLLINAYRVLSSDKEAFDYYSDKFMYIHVDEFQDTNALQYNIIKLLTMKHGNIFAVGDDDQSIYGWRGAKIENILRFDRDFKDAKMYKLEQNYRSTKCILDCANYVIKNNAMRRDKRLWTENESGEKVEFFEAADEGDEAYFAAAIIKSKLSMGYKPSDFAVLMRVNALSRAFEQEFNKYQIPSKVYGGFRFFERKEIKDILAYLRLINNPSDNDAFLRIVNVPKRGIGVKTVEQLQTYAVNENLSLYDSLLFGDLSFLGGAAARKFNVFKNILTELVTLSGSQNIFDLTRSVLNISGFISTYEENTAENEDKRLNINEFLSSVEDFTNKNQNANLTEFLNSVTLSSEADEIGEEGSVTISTIHAVKGLEFKYVFLSGLDETILPLQRAAQDDKELEEERRLMYVGITRAEKKLYITRARSRFLYGERQLTTRSRFLNELAGVVDGITARESFSFDDGFDGYNNREKNADTYSYKNRVYNREKTEDFGGYKGNTAATNFSGSFMRSRQKPTAENAKSGNFSAGVKVSHPKFGEGTILMIKGSGNNAVADIVFKNIGVKQLSLSIAPLKVLQ